MMRKTPAAMARMLAEAMLLGVALTTIQSCAEARAVSEARPARGLRAGATTSRVDQVRLGFALDLEGTVATGCTSRTFALRDPVHYSLRVTDAQAGEVVRAVVRDTVTQRIAWSEARPVPAGGSYATFAIGRGLPEGWYRAESTLGGETASAREFLVRDRSKLSD